MSMKMVDPISRRSLAARRRTTKLLTFEDNDKNDDEKENSLNESNIGRRQSRILNNSFNMDSGADEPMQTPTQLVALYQKTAELAAQGKINIKNAFSITLVERLPQVLNVIALDDIENHHLGPNFVKAGSVIDTSAKIYGFRVDALHTETQKLSGNIMNTDEDEIANGTAAQAEGQTDENTDGDQLEGKKMTRRVKAKASSFIVTDLTKITLEHEFEFRPLQPPHMCRWRGGLGADSIYAEMVSSTMYSSSDFPLIAGFTNANSRPEEQQIEIDAVLDIAVATMIDLAPLRDVIKSNEGHDHVLGNQALRDFVFNETPSGSFIDTIHESCLVQTADESSIDGHNQSHLGDHDDLAVAGVGYNHDELIDAAMDDLVYDGDEQHSNSNEIFKNALNELSNQDPSCVHSHLGNYHASESQSGNLNLPSSNDLLSISIMSNISFADQMPNLLRRKGGQSDYSYFDATKLKLFAGPNIWKYTNLLDMAMPNTSTTTSTIQQQQAPATRTRINSETGAINNTGPKRSIRVDFLGQIALQTSLDQIMSGSNTGRDKKATGTSQSALQLRIREKSLNQMQLARKMRPLTDLTNAHHFPELNFEHLHLFNKHQTIRSLPQDDFGGDMFDDDEDHVLHLPEQHDDENGPISALNYDFIRPIHYEKIEFAKGSSSVNAKILKRQMVEEFNRQTEQQRSILLDSSTASQQSLTTQQQRQCPSIEFSILCENLSNQGHLSLHSDLPSAFYCMLINCNENKLFMKSNSKRDDIFIQERPFIDQRDLSTLSYSYSSSSNLSTTSLLLT